MSGDVQGLYAAILAAPDDDRLRVALGSHHEERADPRGEFFRIQLERAELGAFGLLQNGREIGRERELLAAHGRDWAAAVAGLVSSDRHGPGYRFHRGLVGEVRLELDRFLEVAPRLFAVAPVQHLDLTPPCTRWTELLGSPHLRRLHSLSLAGMGLADADALAFAKATVLGGLRWLSLADNAIGEAGVDALAASPWLARLDVLDLSNNPCDPVPRPAAYEIDGRVTAIDSPPFGWELQRRHGPRAWLAGPEVPDAWPLSRDSYRSAPLPLARTDAEARLYLSRRPCACSWGPAAEYWGRYPRMGQYDYASSVVTVDGVRAVRYSGKCRSCIGRRTVHFRLPDRQPAQPSIGVVYGGAEPSELLDPGEWLDVADGLARHEPAEDRLAAGQHFDRAAAAIDEVGKFAPEGAEAVPASAFTTRAGRAVWEREPGRFRLEQLGAEREAYARRFS